MIKSKLLKTSSIIIFFLLNGCASYKEIKEMKASDAITVDNIKSEILSSCALELMKESGGNVYHRSYDPIRKKWFIVAEFMVIIGGAGNGDYQYSVSFEDILGSKTNVEIRTLKTIWGGNQVSTAKVFGQIKQCENALSNHAG